MIVKAPKTCVYCGIRPAEYSPSDGLHTFNEKGICVCRQCDFLITETNKLLASLVKSTTRPEVEKELEKLKQHSTEAEWMTGKILRRQEYSAKIS